MGRLENYRSSPCSAILHAPTWPRLRPSKGMRGSRRKGTCSKSRSGPSREASWITTASPRAQQIPLTSRDRGKVVSEPDPHDIGSVRGDYVETHAGDQLHQSVKSHDLNDLLPYR